MDGRDVVCVMPTGLRLSYSGMQVLANLSLKAEANH
jgi:hypothetical protein